MKILLGDDHKLFAEGISAVLTSLQPGINIEVSYNGIDALEKITAQTYDIVLLDLRLPGMDGFSLLKKLRELTLTTPIIILTASEDPRDAQEAKSLGAQGFLSKKDSGQQIMSAIKKVLSGEQVFFDDKQQQDQKNLEWSRLHDITPRQFEVLRLLKQGLSNQSIGDELFISKATVKTHVVAIFTALKVNNRVEAIEKAHLLGLD